MDLKTLPRWPTTEEICEAVLELEAERRMAGAKPMALDGFQRTAHKLFDAAVSATWNARDDEIQEWNVDLPTFLEWIDNGLVSCQFMLMERQTLEDDMFASYDAGEGDTDNDGHPRVELHDYGDGDLWVKVWAKNPVEAQRMVRAEIMQQYGREV